MAAPALTSFCKKAFVTGASRGLGRAFAEMLLAEGVLVWGTAREVVRLDRLSQQTGFTAVVLDLRDGAQAETVFAQAAEQAGGFDLVINNAGYGIFADALEVGAEAWHGQIEDMLQTPMRIGRLALRTMAAGGRGCLVNVSSLAVEFPIPYMSGYNVAKAGLSAWSESMAYELAGTDIAVIDLRPGDFRTDFNRAAERVERGVNRSRMQAVWLRLESALEASPPPKRAAADLRRALLRGHRGVLRTGSFFQARLAPVLARFAPGAWRVAAQRKYFGLK